MYPYKILGEFDLYLLCILAGAVGCMFLFRMLSEKTGLSYRTANLALGGGLGGMLLGYAMAVLVQALYNYIARGEIYNTAGQIGSTFYGGLIGGAAGFFAIYLGVGYKLFPDKAHIKDLPTVASLAACAIPFAHAFGRVGCFFAGCCHGFLTDAWYGIYMPAVGAKVFPTQLGEAVFLFALAAFLSLRTARGKRDCLGIYFTAYGFFRFFIEYLRGDWRGASVIPFLSPSQTVALGFVAVGMFLLLRTPGKDIPRENET